LTTCYNGDMSNLVPVCPHVSWDEKVCDRIMSLRPDGETWYCRVHQINYGEAHPEWPTLQWRERRSWSRVGKDLGPQLGVIRLDAALNDAMERARQQQSERDGRKVSKTEIVSAALRAYAPVAAELELMREEEKS